MVPVCVALAACSPGTPEPEPPVAQETPPAEREPERVPRERVVPQPETWDRELPAEVQLADLYDDEVTHVPVRVVDDRTGEPIVGARVANWHEAGYPHAEPWGDLRVHALDTDLDGLVLADRKDYGQWYFVDAPGWAAVGEFGFEEELRLVPGQDVEIELRDWLDRPVSGAIVELLLGCGHTPAVRSETTDAEGRFVFRDVDPEKGTIWVRAAGLLGSSAYSSSPGELPLEDGRRILRGHPAPVLEGRVVNADGSPADGVAVGVPDTHRGPWTTTNADGRFRLFGAPPGNHITVAYTWPAGGPEYREDFAAAPGVLGEFRLEAYVEDAGEEEDEDESESAPLQLLRVRATLTTDRPLTEADLPIRAVRQADGYVEEDEGEFEDGSLRIELELTPGTWAVTFGSATGAIRPYTAEVVIDKEPVDLDVPLTTNPVWRPVVVESGEDGALGSFPAALDGEFHLVAPSGRRTPVTAGRRDAAGDVVADDGLFHVPAAGPFALEYVTDDRERSARVVLDGPPEGPGPQLVLSSPPVEEDEAEWDDGPMSVPHEEKLPKETLTVLLPDGSPAAGVTAEIRRASGRLRSTQTIPMGADGIIEFAFTRHDRVEITADESEELHPLVRFIDEPGPWTLRWPETMVVVRAVDEQGTELSELEVVTGAWEGIFSEEGVVRLRGMPPGPVRFWVAVAGCRAHDVRVMVAEGEIREVTVVMSPRPVSDE